MYIYEPVQKRITDAHFHDYWNGVDELIFYAKALGRYHGATKYCEQAKEIFSQQLNRAKESKYHKMALKIQGDVSEIYSSYCDYSFLDYFKDGNLYDGTIEFLKKEKEANMNVKMTLRAKVIDALKNGKFSQKSNGVDELILYAYQLGRYQGAIKCREIAEDIFSDQLYRVGKSRYHKLALEIQGDIKTLNTDDCDESLLEQLEYKELSKECEEFINKERHMISLEQLENCI